MATTLRRVSIREHVSTSARAIDDPDGWKVEGLNGDPLMAFAQTAIAALAMVKARDLAETLATEKNVVTVIEWEPRSAIGRLVVRAVTGER